MIEPPQRKKLPQYNSIEDAVELITKSKKILVLSGAGISTSAGLPDFRSRNGIYVQIHAEHPDLSDPKSMFDIEYFKKNPVPFYQFAKALYPGQYKPTIGHRFIKCLEEHNKLLRNYSQNIDTLEKQAGIKHVVECHGSFAKATCTNCKYNVDGDVIRNDILNRKIPLCPRCHSINEGPEVKLGVMKPDIVFFGEQLGDHYHSCLESDKNQVDLLIVIGSSLKVRPVALIPRSIPDHVPQVLINKEPLDHMCFDIELLGDCDTVIKELCSRLGHDWIDMLRVQATPLTQIIGLPLPKTALDDSDSSSKSKKLGSVIPTDEIDDSKKISKNIGLDKSSLIQSRVVDTDALNSSPLVAERLAIVDVEKEIEVDRDMPDRAISDCDRSSDEEWEDVEILPQTSSSSDSDSQKKLSLEVPETSYYFLKPNRYMFHGVELTKAQYERFAREQEKISEQDPTLVQ